MNETAGLIDVNAVARILGCSPRSVWAWSESGLFPAPIKLGRLRRWRWKDVENWIAQQAAIAREANANEQQLAQS